MSEELLQTKPFGIGRYLYYRLGSTTLRQLKKAKIINKLNKTIADKKPDGLITLPGGDVKAVIEYKTTQELSTKNKISKAIKQELEVAKFLCKILIVTDGATTYWINALNGEEIKQNGKSISMVFDASSIISGDMTIEERIDLENLIDQAEFSLNKNENNIVEPEILDPTPLAREVWQKIWINTGKEPEKCLYNVVEIFVFKFLSDISVLDYTNNFTSVYQIKEEIDSSAALTRYAQVCRKQIKAMFPEGDDGTTIFNGTIFVNEEGEPNLSQANLFGQVLDSFQKYDEKNGSFRYVTKEFKTRLYETFLRQSAGVKNLGQYFTPRNVVQAMVKMSSAKYLKAGARICDPFCGVGGFVLETISMTPSISREFEPVNGKINPKITLLGLDKGTDEKDDERTIILAKANMLIYFSDLLAKYNSKEHLKSFANNAFNKVFHLIRTNLGTLGKVDEKPFDLILTNPPYVTNSSANIKDATKKILGNDTKPYYSLKGRGVETIALEWIIKNLTPGGEAVVVVPDGLLTQKSVINYIKKNCSVNAIISLPRNTFYATPKKTYILILKKKDKLYVQTDNVFTFIVSEIGETRDTKRFAIDEQGMPIQNDLEDCVANYLQFQNGFSEFKSSRTKIIDFETFNTFNDWLIEKKLTNEEKVSIGLLKPTPTITEDAFLTDLSSLTSIINSFISNGERESFDKVKYISKPLKELFIFPAIKGLTEKFIRSNPGKIPVYGGRQLEEAVGYVREDVPGVKYFENCLAWNREGSVGYVFYHDHRFTTNDHHRPMRLKPEFEGLINLEYVRQVLQQKLLGSDLFEWSKTASKEKVREIQIQIPINSNGDFDYLMQSKLAKRFEKYSNIKEVLNKEIQKLLDSEIQF